MEKVEKLKTPTELLEMDADDLFNYIDHLHSIILNYQIVIDQALDKNVNVKR